MFHAVRGNARILYMLGGLAVSAILIGLLTLAPTRSRRSLVRLVTFVGGLLFAAEFFWPTHRMPTKADPTAVGNFLSPYVVPFGGLATIIAAWTVGLGVINLCQLHGKRLLRGKEGWLNSLAFLASMILMMVVGIFSHPGGKGPINDLYDLLFVGALASLDATMFSIIAFYIVSAAYRAFRVRSVEASLLLTTAVIVMLGQIAIGQALTDALPHTGILHNFRVESVRAWILEIANAAATRAISFGLGIGGLAVALRIWLGLERGSYFGE